MQGAERALREVGLYFIILVAACLDALLSC